MLSYFSGHLIFIIKNLPKKLRKSYPTKHLT